MCQVNSSATVGQELDLSPYHVVLLDASGKEHGFIGYWFYAAGAQAAANGWNAQADRTLTAVIRPGVPVAQGVHTVHTPSQEGIDSSYTPANRRLLVLTGTGKQFLLPTFCDDDDLEYYRDALDDAEQIDIVEDCTAPQNAQEAPSNALDASSEQDDSDVEDEPENAADSEPEPSSFDDDDLNVGYLLALMTDDARQAAERGDLSLMASLGLRYVLMRYLQAVMGAVYDNRVRHTSDIGMIAKGLELFCARIIDGNEDESECESFSSGQDGSIVNDYGTMEALTAWIDEHAENAVPA